MRLLVLLVILLAPEDGERVAALLERFRNGAAPERRAAHKELAALGRRVLPVVKRMADDADPDVRRRAGLLLDDLLGDTIRPWGRSISDHGYDPGSGLPRRVVHRRTGIELALLASRGIYIGVHEVTQQEYAQGAPDALLLFSRHRARLPVVGLRLEQIRSFLKANGLRLPTEAEWKDACGEPGPVDACAWHRDNSKNERHPVGEKEPNALGLHDMLGNVAEWCEDGRVLLGGSHLDEPGRLRPGRVTATHTKGWLFYAGFRVVKDPTRKTQVAKPRQRRPQRK